MRALVLVAGVAFVGAALAFACNDPVLDTYCTGIPTGGCPSDNPSTCVHDAGSDGYTGDPTCAAIYSHTPDCIWSLVQTCPGYVAPHDAGVDATLDAHDAATTKDAARRDAGFEIPEGAGGGPDCADLESPDCPLEEALVCGASCCGCQTLYLCENGGWNVWGECDDGGTLVPVSP
jgi:hypothetical protein